MTIHYSDTVANNRLTQVLNAIDGGGGDGLLVIGTTALSGATGVLVTITFPATAGVVSSRVLTFSGTPIDATASAAGTAALAELRDSTGLTVCSGLTVGATGSGANIIIDTTSITLARPCRLVSLTITHP
jgi:hypothetical protein